MAYGREAPSAERLGVSGATAQPARPPAPMMLELQEQFESTKMLLQMIEELEGRLHPLLHAPMPAPTNETKEPPDRPPMLAAVHENTRVVSVGIERLRDIMQRLVI